MLQQTQVARVVPRYERWLAPSPPRARWPRRRRPTCWRVERARLQPPRAGAPERGRAWSPRDGWPPSGRAAGAARRRAVHRGRGGVVRLGRAGRRGRHQRAAGRQRCDGVERTERDLAERARAAPARPGRGLEPGDDGARRDGVPRPGAAVRGVPGGGRLRRARSRRAGGRAAVCGARTRFEDTDRWARGRVVAALRGRGRAAGARTGAARAGARRARARRARRTEERHAASSGQLGCRRPTGLPEVQTAWPSTGRASRRRTFPSAAGATTPRPSTPTSRPSPPRSTSFARTRAVAAGPWPRRRPTRSA